MRVLQTPTCAVFVRQQEVGCHEVTAEHQAAPSAVEADHKIPAIRSVASDSRLEDHGDFWAFPNLGQRSVDRGDKAREIARVDPVVGNVAANNLCDETGSIVFATVILSFPRFLRRNTVPHRERSRPTEIEQRARPLTLAGQR
jgi:hypothetical protein